MHNDAYWYWFSNLPGIGLKSQKILLEAFGHPSVVYQKTEAELSALLKKKQLADLLASRCEKNILAGMERLFRRGVHFVHRESAAYPKRFLSLYEPPSGLYYIGRLPDFSRPILAMVGSRGATAYGRRMAEEFSRILAGRGVQIVSGLAAGVDTASHRGALSGSGYTVGILGGGIDSIYPQENFNLYRTLYLQGCVLSEYNLGIPNQKGLFPMRNRLISGISDGVFVIEAGKRSGSLITAYQGLEQGKDIFALPGRITDRMSAGCNDLLSEGAFLVRNPEDILKNLGNFSERDFFAGSAENPLSLAEAAERNLESEKERAVYHLLDDITPQSFDELLEKGRFAASELSHILLKLELANLIVQPQQNIYLKKI